MCAVQLLRVSVHERISAAAEDFLLQLEKAEEAAEIPALRALLTERLTAAAEEIVDLFEETVAEYEDRVERSEREICRQRRLLDAVLKPEVKLHRTDVQLLLDPPEQQEWSSSLDQEDPELPHIKEEQEELWSSQEGEQLGGLEEAQIKFTPVPVKSEEEDDDEEKPHSSQLHQRPTEADGEDCGGPEPARNSDPGPDSQPVSEDRASDLCVAEIEVSCEDWQETTDPPSGSNEQTASDEKLSSLDKPFSCSECGKKFARTRFLETHIRTHTGTHTGARPFSCSVCGKKYTIYRYLVRHMTVHTGQRPHSCRVCSKRLVRQSGVECHCCDKSECHQKLCYSHNLRGVVTPLQGLFSCSVCGRRFTQRGYLMQHMDRHTGKIRFRCCVCDKRFAWRHELKSHTCAGGQGEAERDGEAGNEAGESDSDDKTSDSEPEVREDEWTETSEPQSGSGQDVPAGDAGSSTDRKPFICTNCGKMFCGEENLKTHLRTHSGETRFGCSFCEKGLPQRENLSSHLSVHMEDKRFLYCICGKRFTWRYDLKNHSCDNESPPSSASKPHTEVGVDDDGDDTHEPRLTSDSQETAEVLEGDTEERPFGCSRCAKRFRRKKNLQEHMRIHTGEKPYGCSVCLKYFSCSGSLRKHLRIHTGEKPFSCSVCGNRFTESGHLKVHMRTHTGEKPFSCSVCGKSFTWRQSFNNHMKYHTDTRSELN